MIHLNICRTPSVKHWIVLVNSGTKNNLVLQYTVKELGLVLHGYTGVQTLDSYKIATYSNHNIEYCLTNSHRQQHTQSMLFVTIRFTEYNFVLG